MSVEWLSTTGTVEFAAFFAGFFVGFASILGSGLSVSCFNRHSLQLVCWLVGWGCQVRCCMYIDRRRVNKVRLVQGLGWSNGSAGVYQCQGVEGLCTVTRQQLPLPQQQPLHKHKHRQR